MKHKFPVWCLVLSIMFLFFGNLSAGWGLFGALVTTGITFFVLCIPIFIAYARNVTNKVIIIQLSVLLWFIPFSWLIAMGMALFGKTVKKDIA